MGGGLGPSSLGVTKWETVKAYRLKMQDTYRERKNLKGLVGGPLLVEACPAGRLRRFWRLKIKRILPF